ncbi:ferredoxin-NADP reductase [Panacagrimonas perspica]|uniref:Ferredoxin-NADP reductase n=1 Tax=Panacagrimonas perspica TaxID=381431 RepID=A0A4S3KBK8_9GAMM|nr:ferredoxin reductase [Panacagrimonas perspica]TDU32315.1 ferredoxin-NADP reductase [Panacagrimonas perspica]THD05254.1 hypothetical protein B1810_00430 [Panacagrimonas perspica]
MTSLRRYLQPLVSPPVFDFWASRFSPAASWDRVLAKVVARRVESRDAVTLELRANRHFKGLRPGQHVNVTAEVGGARLTRSYSPSLLSADGRRLSITVRQVDGGKLSTQLCQNAQVGDVVELGAAFGDMTWTDTAPGSRLLLAAGSGITPMISLIRSAVTTGTALDVDLVYWARRRDELCFVDELRDLATRMPGLRCHFVLTRETELRDGEHAGRPNQELLLRLVPDLAHRQVFACGPDGFVETVRELLATRVAQFHSESFTPRTVLAAATGTVRVELTRSRRTFEIPAGMPLLAALESQGLRPAYGCRMGLCNTCACGKSAGSTQNVVDGSTDAEPTSALRICVNRAASDLILDL